MRTFTEKEKRDGEMAVRRLSLEAQWLYENSDPFRVYAVKVVENANDPMGIVGTITRYEYYVDGFGDLSGPMSFEELNWWLADMVYTDYKDEFNEAMED